MKQWKITGGSYPALIWGRMMKEIAKDETGSFEVPAGISALKICKDTGLLPGPFCPAETVYTEYFVKGQTPTGICSHGLGHW